MGQLVFHFLSPLHTPASPSSSCLSGPLLAVVPADRHGQNQARPWSRLSRAPRLRPVSTLRPLIFLGVCRKKARKGPTALDSGHQARCPPASWPPFRFSVPQNLKNTPNEEKSAASPNLKNPLDLSFWSPTLQTTDTIT